MEEKDNKFDDLLKVEATQNGFVVTDENNSTARYSFESKDAVREFMLNRLEEYIDGNVSFDETHNPHEVFTFSFRQAQ